MANTLSLGSGNWGAKESLLLGYYENGGKFFPETFDVTRATGGTRVNKAGLIETPAEIGSEEITNGSFDTSIAIGTNGSGWSTVIDGTNTVAYSNGGVKLTRFNTNECKIYANTIGGSTTVLTSGKTYKLTYQVLSSTSNPALRYFTGGGYVTISNEIGVHSLVFVQGGSGLIVFYNTTNNSDITIDNVSVKEYNDKNLARIDYLDDAKGALLTEPQSTNLITQSELFSDSSWTKNNSSVTSGFSSPDGANNAFNLNIPISNGYLLTQLFSYSAVLNQSITASIFAKNEITNFLSFGGATVAGTDVYSIQDYGNGWFRHIVTRTFTTTATGGIQFIVFNQVGNNVIWGAQLEGANAFPYNGEYSTSYIPTDGSAVTRNKDQVTNGGDVNSFGSEGVLYANIAALANDEELRRISINDGSTNNRVTLDFTTISNQVRGFITSNGTTQAILIGNTTVTNYFKLAVKYKENDFSFWLNGVEVATDTSGNLPIGLSEISFDNGTTGSNIFFGKTKNIQVFNTALSDSDLLSLTTTGSVPYWTQYSAMATTLNYTNK